MSVYSEYLNVAFVHEVHSVDMLWGYIIGGSTHLP